MDKKIEELHKKACNNSQEFYIDPDTGFQVFTEIYHKTKGYCCESGCRHCPYGFNEKGEAKKR